MPPDRRSTKKKLRRALHKISLLPISVDDIRLGDVYLLPAKESCDLNRFAAEELDIDDGCYGHPILVFAINKSIQQVLALIVSALM